MDLQVQKLQQEIIDQKEYEQMLEDQIKEHEETIDKQKLDINKKETEIKNLKKQLQEAIKKADVINNSDDISGAKIIQLEVEIHDLNQQLQESSQKIKALTQQLSAKIEENDMEIEILKDDHLKQLNDKQTEIAALQQIIDELKKMQNNENSKQSQDIVPIKQKDQEELLQQIEYLTNQIEQYGKQLEIKDKQIEQLQLNQGKQGSIDEVGKRTQEEDQNLEEKIAQLEETILQYQEENSQFIIKEEENQKEKQLLKQQLESLEKQIQEIQQQEQDASVAQQLEDLKLEYEELVEEYTSTNEKLQQSESECQQLTDKCQEYLSVKEQLQDQITQFENTLQHYNEVLEENNELKQLMNKAQEQINNLQSNNEYQTLYLQLRDEYEEFKEQLQINIKDKDQQLYQAIQFCQELEPFKEQAHMLEENNKLLSNQLQTQLENNQIYQQKIEQLENQLNTLQNQNQDINDLLQKLDQLKQDNENLKTQNYDYAETIKNYEIQMDALKQIECDSPKKISKLQQENSETTAEYIKLKENTQREIHLLKQERSNLQNEINEIKSLLDTYINNGETFESQKQYIIDYWNKLQSIQDQQNNLVEKFQLEIQELNENIGQIQSQQNLNTDHYHQLNQEFQINNYEKNENLNQSLEQLETNNQINQNNFHFDVKKIQQIDYIDNSTQTEEIIEKKIEKQDQIQLHQSQTIQQKVFQSQLIQTDDLILSPQEMNVRQFNNQICQTDEQEIKQIENIDQYNHKQNDQINDLNIQIIQKQSENDQIIIQQLIQPFENLEEQSNQFQDLKQMDQLKKKVEDMDNLRKSLEKEIYNLKDKIKKLEDKLQNSQKPTTPRRQSDAKDDRKKLQDNELIQRLQKQIKELQEEIQSLNVHQLNEQIEQQSNEIEQLQQDIQQYKEQLIKQRQQTIKLKNQLDTIYNLGPQALSMLQSEPKREFQSSIQTIQQEKYQISSFLYIKSQKSYQCQFIEINRKQLKLFQSVKGRIEKAVFDTYTFDEIFFDTQKIHQYLDQSKLKLQNELTKIYLILGQSKTHKKLIMIMLIELLYNLIQKQQLNQKIIFYYQERIGKQWIEIEQFNTQTSSIQDLDYTLQAIKVHLLTKQKSLGEKIRKLQITYQSYIDNQLQNTSTFIIATCPSLPQGDFKNVIQKILNCSINTNMQFNIFLNISPALQYYQKSTEIISMAKTIKLAKGQLDIALLSACKSLSEYNLIDEESQKQLRIINNKLILKQQEIDQVKKTLDLQIKQQQELQIKFDNQLVYQNTIFVLINNIILEIKQKINMKMNQKKNKKSQNITFLDKLAFQLDQIIRKQQISQSNVENVDKFFKSKASEIVNPFL